MTSEAYFQMVHMMTVPQFYFVTCQPAAQQVAKLEIAKTCLSWRLSFSKPGFLTFKTDQSLPHGKIPPLVFSRVCGRSLGRVTGQLGELAVATWDRVSASQNPSESDPRPDAFGPGYAALHVWHPQAAHVGRKKRIELDQLVAESRKALQSTAPPEYKSVALSDENVSPSRGRQKILDCIVMDSGQWWIGTHCMSTVPSRYAGGIIPVKTPEVAISRAYYKINEAIAWSRFPLRRGQQCLDLGSAPGGASQALLDRGLDVLGIDPAAMDSRVLAHPRFRHLKMRGAGIKRRGLAGFQWLISDMNVAPQFTLDAVQDIVTHPQVHVKGMLLTIKLLDWDLADQIPEYLNRVRSWGYRDVRARQLVGNRQEICIAALQRSALRRLG